MEDCKATISKNKTFIKITPTPTEFKQQGIKIWHRAETATEYGCATCSIFAGQSKYSLTELPKEARESIYQIEIKNGDIWEVKWRE